MHRRKYSYIFANDRHQEIQKLSNLKRDNDKFAFLLHGKPIGEATLLLLEKLNVQTECVSLDKKYRKKGHGIWLYKRLIACARKIGAKRIYSSKNLNKHSRRMWSEKLPKLFDVKEQKTRIKCRRCGHQKRILRYYIVL
jgi:N-acetylglutamate synthase-like GNAT family acetyltransferase